MRAINGANRLLSLITLGLGIVLGVVASPGAAVVGHAVAAAPACVAAVSDPPVRVWRDGRFAGP
ncbi:MAG TPA: hypothetical protein VFX03_14730 [Thermomicrobiales bacterium]|nr:hypothetical protein [Thermomicrobiales bacterium]